jgi:hypothetical protein
MVDTDTATSKAEKVPFPERKDDGCTHCGMVLSVYNERTGELNVEASENAQRAHAANVGCAATPQYVDPNIGRGIDKKSGRLDGEYSPAWKR